MLSFEITDISDKASIINQVSSYELCRDIDAPCDSLRITFLSEGSLNEICKIKAYLNGDIVFNGIVDTQREQMTSKGRECFIYARSTACLLVDNEATPFRYNNPSALTLFTKNARDFGFLYGLPELICNADYQVNKGTSCYGAINNFVKGLTGKSVVVNPNNMLVLASGDGNICIDDYLILSEKRIINRGRLVSRADYKINSNNNYSYHIKSRLLEGRGISCSRKINLSALPAWQREQRAHNIIEDACSSYYTIELIVDGFAIANVFDKAVGSLKAIDDFSDYRISSICASLDQNGEVTRLILNKQFDLEEITYVAE